MTTVVVTGRPGAARLLAGQLEYATKDLWRTRISLIFSLVLPLTLLGLTGAVAGNEVLDSGVGGQNVPMMQFVTPIAGAMGVLFAAYPTVATGLALARERGVLKRIRGSPLPPWTYLVGRIGAAVAFAFLAFLLMVAVGVVAYDVQIQWQTAAATVATLVLGIASFAALGVAVAALSPSSAVAQAASTASALVLLFFSEVFTFGGEAPAWLTRTGSVFPLRHFVLALEKQFDPFQPGSGWQGDHLAVIAAWLVAALVVAARAFRWEPRSVSRGAAGVAAAPATAAGRLGGVVEAERPGVGRMVATQTRWANRATWRDPGTLFFAVAMPVGLYALLSALFGGGDFRPYGTDFTVFYAGSMATYGASVTAFSAMPEMVAVARDRGVLKRLRGTPLQPTAYLTGRMLSVLWISLLTAALVVAVGAAFFDVPLRLTGLLFAAAAIVLGAVTFAACGLALAALVPNSKSMAAVGLGILLPVGYVSDALFLAPGMPEWIGTLGSVFPMRPVVHAVADALDPAAAPFDWAGLAVVLAWLVAATALAVRRFRWEPRL